jgi:hypothetical protein
MGAVDIFPIEERKGSFDSPPVSYLFPGAMDRYPLQSSARPPSTDNINRSTSKVTEEALAVLSAFILRDQKHHHEDHYRSRDSDHDHDHPYRLDSLSRTNSPQGSKRTTPPPPIPSLEEFLVELEGNRVGEPPGTYENLIETFRDNLITIELISKMKKEEFNELGITKLGVRMKLKEAADKYVLRRR